MSTLLNFQERGPLKKYIPNNRQLPLILIHGLLGSLENLGMIAKTLSEQYRVISIDVRNHGSSFHATPMDYNTLAQDVIEVLDHLNISKANILGHSMGGKIAMQIALERPNYVEKLIVADIAPIAYPAHHQQILTGLQSLDFSQITTRKSADDQLANYVEESGIRQFLLRNLQSIDGILSFKCNLTNIAACYTDIMKGYEGNEIFNGETLFIKGGNSNYITRDHQAIIAKLFPKAKAKIISGAGHWLHAEKTTAFNKIVNDFLSSKVDCA